MGILAIAPLPPMRRTEIDMFGGSVWCCEKVWNDVWLLCLCAGELKVRRLMDGLKTADVLYSYSYLALICLRLKYVPYTVCIVSIVVDMMTSAVHNLLVHIFAVWLAIPKTGSFGGVLPCVVGFTWTYK
jgi:hypothetical protein